MYSKKLEYWQKQFKKEKLFSGIITTALHAIPVGSPCLIIPGNSQTSSPSSIHDPYNFDSFAAVQTTSGGEIIIKESSKIGVDIDVSKKVDNIDLLFLFPTVNNGLGYYMTSLPPKTNKIHYIQKPPIIYDVFNVTELERLEDCVEDLKTFPSAIFEQLKTDRFVNYTFQNVTQSTMPQMMRELRSIIKAFSEKYPNNTACYRHISTGSRVLFDTLSISFYNLMDIMPIFNYQKSEGVGMEIMLTNSELKPQDIMREGRSSIFRLLFAKSRENVFSIDGESIENASYFPVKDAIAYTNDLLKSDSPNDRIYKKNKKKKEEGKCAV